MTDNITHLQDRLDAVNRELWRLIDERDELQNRIDEYEQVALELQRQLGKAKEEAK